MVNCEGQLYTMEGIAAAMIMIFTIYLVMSTTTLYTPGDSHINDMQLEQTGNGCPADDEYAGERLDAESQLQAIVEK